MNLGQKRRKFTRMVADLLFHATWVQGYQVAIDWVKRDVHTQTMLVNEGLSKTMKSKHLNALAIDLLLFEDGTYLSDGDHPNYKTLGEYWKLLGGTWGGDWKFKDAGHFELKD